MKNNKYIAPVIISILFIAYFLLYMSLASSIQDIPPAIKAAAVILPAIFIVVMIKTLMERIKEIKKGEDDDIGKY